MHCFERAERTSEGSENDHYRCANGHTFAIDWSYDGPPKTAAWPPSAEEAERFAMVKKMRGH